LGQESKTQNTVTSIMKKNLILFIIIMASALGVKAQGTVVFNASNLHISTNTATGGAATGLTGTTAGSYYYALFYSTTATTVLGTTSAQMPDASGSMVLILNDSNWTLALYGTNSLTAGRMALATTVNGDGSVTVPGVSAGTSASFVVLGWSSNLGTSLSTLAAGLQSSYGWIGESAVLTPGPLGQIGSTPAPSLFPSGSGFILGLNFIPEPSTLALGAAGFAGFLLYRRRPSA
jgi:PEP-CTERM motif